MLMVAASALVSLPFFAVTVVAFVAIAVVVVIVAIRHLAVGVWGIGVLSIDALLSTSAKALLLKIRGGF